MSDHDGFFDERGPARVDGRYRLPHPETGVEQSWTAATTHAELPEDSFALTRYQLRMLLLGLRERPDVLRMLEAAPDQPAASQLDEWIGMAHAAMATDEKANRGTAIHGVLQQVDRAWNAETGLPDPATIARLPEWAMPYVKGYVEELRRQGLTPLRTMAERQVVNTDLSCAGTIDNLYAEADGTIALGDKKTGRLDYPERKYSIQLAVYAGARWMLDPSTTGLPQTAHIDLRSVGLRQDYAVLIHVDPETGACSTYRVDLRRGQYGANLAVEVRAWRNERGLLLPYVPPAAQVAPALEQSTRHLQAVPSGPLVGETRVNGNRVEQWDGHAWQDMGEAVPGPADTVDIRPGTARQNNNIEQAGRKGNGSVEQELVTLDNLMKLPKPELQRVLRDLDPSATINHQRKILAEKILTAQAGGTIATTTPKLGDPAELPAGPATTGAEDPTDPRSPAFHRARLAEIAAAESVGTLGRIHGFVLRVGGEQAWTDALTEAARARAAVLDGAAFAVDPLREAAERITRATSSEEIAQIWADMTIGGSTPDRWTDALSQLAEGRLREITPPAPTVNPYAPAGTS